MSCIAGRSTGAAGISRLLRLLRGLRCELLRRMRQTPRFHCEASEQEKQNHAENFLLFFRQEVHGRDEWVIAQWVSGRNLVFRIEPPMREGERIKTLISFPSLPGLTRS
jgi:hypothetical protein